MEEQVTGIRDSAKQLYNWLEQEFYKSNHPKYRRYFNEWFSNLLPSQLGGFYNQMIGQITKSKVI